MTTPQKKSFPIQAWLALVTLTFLSLFLGEKFGHAAWMPVLVAGIIWVKGAAVARYFIESHTAHPFIAWLLRAFTALAPIALLLTTWLRK